MCTKFSTESCIICVLYCSVHIEAMVLGRSIDAAGRRLEAVPRRLRTYLLSGFGQTLEVWIRPRSDALSIVMSNDEMPWRRHGVLAFLFAARSLCCVKAAEQSELEYCPTQAIIHADVQTVCCPPEGCSAANGLPLACRCA